MERDWREVGGTVTDPGTGDVIDTENLTEYELMSANLRDALDKKTWGRWVKDICAALKKDGFVQVEGHGITPELLERSRESIMRVFHLPADVQKRYTRPEIYFNRGIGPLGCEKAVDGVTPNLMWYFMSRFEEWPEDVNNCPFGENLWPAEVPEFRMDTLKLMEHSHGCALLVARAVKDGFGVDFDIPRMTVGAEHIQRTIVSPDLTRLEEEFGEDVVKMAMRSFPHDDINLLTAMPVASAKGLIIKRRSGEWSLVQTKQNVIVVDTGEQMRWIPGLESLTPTRHGVLRPWGDAAKITRVSFPFFFHLLRSVKVETKRVPWWPLPEQEVATIGDLVDYRLYNISKHAM